MFGFLAEGKMKEINIGRVVLGGIVAGVIMFIGDGIVHGSLLAQEWARAMAALGRAPADGSQGFPYFAAYDLLKGIAAIWIYAAIRPRFGPGVKTAALAGLVTWFLTIPLPLLGLLPMNQFGRRLPALWSLYSIVPMVIAAVVGAWLYREESAPAVSAQPATRT
jgi:hypothetical protein